MLSLAQGQLRLTLQCRLPVQTLLGCEMDGTCSGLRPLVDFGFSGVEPLYFSTIELGHYEILCK
jgi:hypothetical protein